ncbi:alanine racemase [Pseudalkalibacillus caeni]|uniref:Alanine racemase n=1 Tax=Exobacillus caeni TaxID=2574798 RepID=A0A5R9EXL5_9BACL|nr:alanine racemase [Pseudalkalibacillus caeni]TLS34906.1 alanine racemase [Pseudalkalibacillus caeni]
MEDPFYRDTWAEIDLDAIEENIAAFKKHLPQETGIMAVVKANAYGHGSFEVAKQAIAAGASYLAVALLDEAIALREKGITHPILVLGWVRPEYAGLAAKLDVTLTVFQEEWIQKAASLIDTKPLKLHLKMDTGMGRIGIKAEKEAKLILSALFDNKDKFVLEGVFTHFATADEPGNSFVEEQNKTFGAMLGWLKEEGAVPPIIHTSNSAATARFPERARSIARVGISMYGLAPSEELAGNFPFPLKPAFSLHSRLVHVKQMSEGEPVSYGSTYKTSEGEWIGTIPVGYADGWIRKIGSEGHVLVNGGKAPIVGRICMDQFMVRLPRQLEVGTKVTLIGRQRDSCISVDDIARQLETINYEIPCMISSRVPRIFMKKDKKVGVMNTILKK